LAINTCRDYQREYRTFAFCAGKRKITPKKPGQLLCDCQTQARTAILAGMTAIRLTKRLKYSNVFILWNTNTTIFIIGNSPA
jgi:hypothetical protein